MADDMSKCGVYVIQNLVNGKRYVGSTGVSFEKRLTQHLRDLRMGKHYNPMLQAAWTKYGESNFLIKVAEYCLPEHAVAQEQVYIDYYKSSQRAHGYNICVQAGSRRGSKCSPEARANIARGSTGRKLSPEAIAKSVAKRVGAKRTPEMRQRMSEAQLRKPPVTEETRRRLSVANRGRKMPPEAVAKISAANRGRKRDQAFRDACSARNKGRKTSDETKAKQSIAHTGRKHSPEACEKISASRRQQKASDETRRILSKAQTGKKQSEETKRKRSESVKRARAEREAQPGYVDTHRIAMRALWADPEFRAKMAERRKKKSDN